MRPLPRALACFLLVLFVALASARAQVPRDVVVDLAATTSNSVPYITLNWTLRQNSFISGQSVYRRLKGDTTWGSATVLTTTATTWADTTALPNVEYEYKFQRTWTGTGAPSVTGYGYLNAGVQVPVVEARGIVLLVIDDTMVAPLATEIAQLKADMTADGWTVQTIVAPRTGTVVNTRNLIKAAYDADPTNVKMAYLLGQVPVPYSGQIAPDGHGDHVGAWGYDGYYGDMTGTTAWTDTTVNTTTASRVQNQNIPGDGKFDQSSPPSLIELGLGRVNMRGMTKAPNANVSETALLRRYLRKAHDFRYQLGAYASVPRRTLLRDGFGYFGGEAFAVTGWVWAFSSVGVPPAAPIVDQPPSGGWWDYAAANTYLLGYGDGGGSYESASSVGSTTDFGRKPSRVVFTSLFGSYHGDWDADNNFMRSVLAGNASGDSLGLCCFWGGRPAWLMHWTGMGAPLGLATRNTMNATLTGGGSYSPGLTGIGTSVPQALMGDPTLRLHMVQPPRNFTAVSSNSQVALAWTASTESNLQGYHVYRAADPAGPYTRLTATPLATPGYSDSTATAGQPATYMVRTLKLETVPGGSYYNLSQGSLATLTVNAGATAAPRGPTSLTVTQLSGVNAQLSWTDNASDETGFRVERKTNGSGSYVTVGTPGANATSFSDPGPFTVGNVYYYRVFATGPGGDSLASEEVSFDANAGFFDMSAVRLKVSKTAGTIAIPVNRFGGVTGSVTCGYFTSDLSAVSGVHYTATSGTLTWADGDTSPKNIFIPLINDGVPRLPRQFTLTLNNPGGGGSLTLLPSMAVLIEDPAAIINSGYTSANIGTVTDSSPVVEAEGAIGGATLGGADLTNLDTADSGQFAYKQITGDAQMIAFVPVASPNQTNARFALMARDTTASNAMLAAAITSGDPTTYGAKMGYRTSTGGNLIVGSTTANSDSTPRWLRLTRFGNSFTAESSVNGVNWSTINTPVTVTLPSTTLWGVYHSSDDVLSSSGNGNFQLGAFTNVSLGPLPPPDAPGAFTAAYTASATPYINLTWTAPRYITGYILERRAEGQANFTQIATPASNITTFADTNIAADTAYEYRLTAVNASGNSANPPIARATTLPADATVVIPAQADAAIQAASPAGTFGTQNTLTVCGSDPVTASTGTIVKSWLRFDLSTVQTLKSAKLKIGITNTNLGATFTAGKTFTSRVSLLQEVSDTWDESTINWSNAPQNDTAGLLLTGTSTLLNTYNITTSGAVPANNSLVSITLGASLIYNGRGPNGLVTLAFIPTGQCGAINFASHESTGLAGPVLEVTYTANLPRPSFLSAKPGAVSGVGLAWTDNATTEAGFALERRAAGGTFAPLQTFAADTTSFTDTTATPGVTYEYRVKATGSPGDSSWSVTATATAPAYTYTYWLQQNGLPADGSGAGAPNACPKADGYSNLFKAALGLSPSTVGNGGRLTYSQVTDAGQNYLAVTYTRPEPAPSGIVYMVEGATNLPTWSTITPVEITSSVSNGLKTTTVRDVTPITPGAKRYLRLRVNLP